MAGRKLFVGSLPHGIQDATLRAEFGRYGIVEDIFVKPGCEVGRQWAFVTMTSAEDAQRAKDATDRLLQFPGCEKPCDVMVAKNQNAGSEAPMPMHHGGGGAYMAAPRHSPMGGPQPRKIFVGSLPNTITDMDLRAEFGRYGHITDVFVNQKSVEHNRQWAFVTFDSPDSAAVAKSSCDRVLMFPGSDRAAEVTLARHQGMFGQESLETPGYHGPAPGAPPVATGPKKIFVGSMPNHIVAEDLRAEFGKYGQVIDVHVNVKPVEPGRQWAFVTFATADQALSAKTRTDKILVFPGADRACEVMLAKNQGKNGAEPLSHGGHGHAAPGGYHGSHGVPAGQPPPPSTPAPAGLTPWRMYTTAAGLPYYHNSVTNKTQWECPPDLQVPGQGAYGAAAQQYPSHQHYSPY